MNMKTLHLGLFFFFICLLACYPTCADGRDVPLRLRSFYREVKRSGCRMPLATGFKDGHGHSGFTYCGDYSKRGIIYLSGPRSHRLLADMDVDCDGANNTVGRCVLWYTRPERQHPQLHRIWERGGRPIFQPTGPWHETIERDGCDL
ncbi:hypothetical protein DTO166G5_3693 [Paecilomyces variotii]|nr:hypothetical protein DTO166G5_3693 [Paecilomyces variotii]